MQSIDFKLDVRFLDYHKTLIYFDKIGNNKEQIHDNFLMRYGAIFQPKENNMDPKTIISNIC